MEYNCRLYEYPVGNHVTFYKKTITRQEKDTEKRKDTDKGKEKDSKTRNNINDNKENADDNLLKPSENKNRSKEQEEHSIKVSLSATKNRIYNIARSNTWDWFITLTFDRKKTNASDYDMIVYRLHIFLNNLQKRKCPDLKYLIVPELHLDKENYHFHGLISGCDNMRFRFSGLFDKKGRPIYDVLDWNYGFTTATRIGDSGQASSYITKYVTKQSELKLKNKNRYMCSRNIGRTQPSFHILDEEEFLNIYAKDITYAKNVHVPEAHQIINYYELKD